MKKTKKKNFHLAVVTDTKTGLHHGAVYRNHPCPDGGARWLLLATTDKGFGCMRKAAVEINKLSDKKTNPEAPDSLDLNDYPIEDLSGFNFPRGSVITRVKDKSGKEPLLHEVRFPGEHPWGPAKREITEAQFEMMKETGKIEFDSCCMDDPNLHYTYVHWTVV